MRYLERLRIAFCLAVILAIVYSSALSQESQRQTAFSLEQQGKDAEAEAVWLSISKQEPSNPEPYAHLGLLEARQEHYPGAIRYYRRAFALSPAMTGLRLNLGLAFFKNGDYKQAIAMFAPMLKAHPDDQQLTILVGMSHYGLGQFPAAASIDLRRAEKRGSAEPCIAADSDAQLPLFKPIPVRAGLLSQDRSVERGVGRGRHAGRRGT